MEGLLIMAVTLSVGDISELVAEEDVVVRMKKAKHPGRSTRVFKT
jgi:hypothetical protein